jgi:hypothetical protein
MQKTRHFDRIGKSIQQYYADGGAFVTSDTGRCPAAPSARRQNRHCHQCRLPGAVTEPALAGLDDLTILVGLRGRLPRGAVA